MLYLYTFIMRCILLSVLLLAAFHSNAQSKAKDTVINGQAFTYVEEMPVARYDYNKYLATNIKYPDSARKHNIEGRVILKFLINEDGHISDCEIVKSVDRYLDEEACRVIGKMPAWKPGKQDGKPVKVYYTMPVMFKLKD